MQMNNDYTLRELFTPRLTRSVDCDVECDPSCPTTALACQTRPNSGNCDPSECQSGCCVDGVCAANDSACKDSTFIFLMICIPFIIIICTAVVVGCVRVWLKSRRPRRREIRLPQLPGTPRLQLVQVEQGEPIQGQVQQQVVGSPARLLLAHSRAKIVPINTVHLDTETQGAGSPSVTPSAFDFKVVEIDDDEFKKKMREGNSSPFFKESLTTLNVLGPNHEENILEKRQSQEVEEGTRSIQLPEME